MVDWRLEHAGYVYRVFGSVTTKSLFEAGLKEEANGEIVGVYLFRAI